MRIAAYSPLALAMALAVAACETEPTQPLGPQASGGIAATGQGGDGGSIETPSGTGGSLLDAGRGAAFAATLAADDARYFQQAEISARNATIGSTIRWTNPATGTAGTITPLNDVAIAGQDCRVFFLTATSAGRQSSESVTACLSGSDWTTLPS
ncbi:MAG: RT0821/Lpp0805 family surface protein [Alphaproteobacteria bacterium]